MKHIYTRTQAGTDAPPPGQRLLPCLYAVLPPMALLLVLPLIGVAAAGRPWHTYTEFPPTTQYVEHAGFSWPVFLALAGLVVAVLAPFEWRAFAARGACPPPRPPVARFPAWGWAGLLLTLVTWVLAWTRWTWFAPWQLFTFSPLWIGYILVINGLTYRRTGHCLLLDQPARLVALAAASAAFWWYFEYLNRFVQNWHYVGIGALSPQRYFLFATLPFATVLPAVLSTRDWLAADPRCGAGLDAFLPIDAPHPRRVAGLTLALSSAALALIGVFPDALFPVLWMGPLLIVTAWRALRGEPTLFATIRRGQWRELYLLAASALICGFFWEMWNVFSEAKWVYTVPYVNRFKLFEMPLLGFAGYLPFGLECAVIARQLGIRNSE